MSRGSRAGFVMRPRSAGGLGYPELVSTARKLIASSECSELYFRRSRVSPELFRRELSGSPELSRHNRSRALGDPRAGSGPRCWVSVPRSDSMWLSAPRAHGSRIPRADSTKVPLTSGCRDSLPCSPGGIQRQGRAYHQDVRQQPGQFLLQARISRYALASQAAFISRDVRRRPR